jgi:hypothetical protein
MSPRKVGAFRRGGEWAFRVVVENLPEDKTCDDVNSGTGIAVI